MYPLTNTKYYIAKEYKKGGADKKIDKTTKAKSQDNKTLTLLKYLLYLLVVKDALFYLSLLKKR